MLFNENMDELKSVAMDLHQDFSPRILPLRATKQHLTSAGGLGTLIEAFDLSKPKSEFKNPLEIHAKLA